jgi:predicted protein tyrosine phosphatase
MSKSNSMSIEAIPGSSLGSDRPTGTITLTSLVGVLRAVHRVKAVKLVSLLDPEWFPDTPPTIEPRNHLRLGVCDLVGPMEGKVIPCEEHIEALLEFGARWQPEERIVVHCHAGVSRSSAAIAILMTQKNPGREFEIAKLLRQRAHHIRPNSLMIEIADRLLRCEGRLVEAVKAMREPTLKNFEERFVSLPAVLRHD